MALKSHRNSPRQEPAKAKPYRSAQIRTSIRELRKEELERAAREVIDQVGFNNTTVERIAALAGASKGVAHHYFKNKDEMLVAAVRHANRLFARDFLKLLARAKSPSERLWTIITSQLSQEYLTPQYLRAYLTILEAGFRKQEIVRIYDITERRGRSNIAFALRAMMPARDVPLVAHNIWSMIEGAWLALPPQSENGRKEIVLAIAGYVTSSTPGFDESVITFDEDRLTESGASAGRRASVSHIRRLELEKAALDIISRSGLRALTIQGVAKQAGLSKGIVHHYFASKDALVAAAIRQVNRLFGQEISRLLSRTRSPSERLWAIIEGELAAHYMQIEFLSFYLASLEAGFRNQAIVRNHDIAERRGRSNLAFALKALTDARNAQTIAFNLWTLIEGAWLLPVTGWEIERTSVLSSIADYLIRSVPGFDASVVSTENKPHKELHPLSIDHSQIRSELALANSTHAQNDRAMPFTPISTVRRQELLTAAFRVLLRDGLNGATTSSIAREAGASKGTVHSYFPSKRALILAALRWGHSLRKQEITQRLRASRSPQQRLSAFIDVTLGPSHLNHEHCALWIESAAEALNDPEIARLLNAIRRREQSTLLHALRQLLAEPEVGKVLLSLRATVEACRLWVSYIGWYDSAHATALAYSLLKQTVPDFDFEGEV
jgi:TetR/AcrR family transcriptional repressor of bet genes